MCTECDERCDEEIHNWYRKVIRDQGWVVIFVDAEMFTAEDENGDEIDGEVASLAYTVGLTRFHGHPELLISGMDCSAAQKLLNEFGRQIAGGNRFRPGQLVQARGKHRMQFLKVDDPTHLVEAQNMYASWEAGLVPALQIVYTDHAGRWPWAPGRRPGYSVHELFGRPAYR